MFYRTYAIIPPLRLEPHKARMDTYTVRFFLWMSTIFSICRLWLSLVHFLGEAARHRADRLGSRLYVSHVCSRPRAHGVQTVACEHVQHAEDSALQGPVGTTGLQITARQGIAIDDGPQYRGVW